LKGKVSLGLETGGHTSSIVSLVFTPDGRRLISSGGGLTQVWNVATGERERFWRMPVYVGRLAVTPDGKTLAVAGHRYKEGVKRTTAPVWLLDLNDGKADLLPASIP